MITFILNIIFWSVLFFCGWQVFRFIFKEKRIEVLLSLSFIIGAGIYIFLLNLLSYFIPIAINFYLILGFLLLISLFLFFLKHSDRTRKLEWSINKKERIVIFTVALVIMVLTGLIAARSLGGDDLSQFRLASAASIAGGNFPVKELNIPENYQAYHYAPNLLFAAVSKITNLPVWFAFDLTVFLFSGVIFLLIFNIAKLFIKNNIGSFLVALVGMFGGGFRFIYGFDGLITLYKKFILHYNIEHPFKFFGDIWSSNPLTGSLVGNMFYGWSVLAWSLVLAIIYLYLRNINNKKWSYCYSFLMIVLLAVLALNFEISFLIICFGIFFAPFIFYFQDKNKDKFKLLLKHSLLVLAITSILVLFQGGTITAILKNIVQHKVSYGVSLGFSIFKNPLSFDTGVEILPFYGSAFILNFGLIYFLIIPAIILIARKYFKSGIFLIAVSCFSFFVPLFVSFNWLWQENLNRFFLFSSLIWAILVGLFLITILLRLKKKSLLKKIVIYICLIVICLDGILFLSTRPLYKRDEHRLDNNSFFAKLTPPTKIESAAYKWVKENSDIKDYFLVFANINDIGNQNSVLQNFRFVMSAQRLAPIYTHNHNYVVPGRFPDDYFTSFYKRLISDCNKDDMKILNYKYLYVNENWPDGFEEKCLTNNSLELEIEAQEGDKFIRIYKVL